VRGSFKSEDSRAEKDSTQEEGQCRVIRGLAKLSKFSCGLGFPWPCGSIERGTTSGGQTTLLMPEASFHYWRP
jgi:hypothetical protein